MNNHTDRQQLRPKQSWLLLLSLITLVPWTTWALSSPTLVSLPANPNVLSFGTYYGILFILFLYNFLIFLIVRDSSYFYYIIAIIIGYAVLHLHRMAIWHLDAWLWPIAILLNSAISVRFAARFLETKHHIPTFSRSFNALIPFNLACILWVPFLAKTPSTVVLFALVLFTVLCICITAAAVWMRGFTAARFYLLAWILIALDIGLFALHHFAITIDPLLHHPVLQQILSIVSLSLMALSLSDRFKLMARDKVKAEHIAQNNQLMVMHERDKRTTAELLQHFTESITASLKPPAVFAVLFQGLKEFVPYTHAVALKLTDDTITLQQTAGYTQPEILSCTNLNPTNIPALNNAFAHQKPLYMDAMTPQAQGLDIFRQDNNIKTWQIIPLKNHMDVILLGLSVPYSHENTHQPIVAMMCQQAGIALTNAHLHQTIQQQAQTDDLTGLYNRRQFLALATREFDRAFRNRGDLSAILFDVDSFKSINDIYGHGTGDAVLQQVARKCAQVLRKTDVFGRSGGDEFIIILPDTSATIAYNHVAKRLASTIANHPITTEPSEIHATLSIGISEYSPQIATLQQLLVNADAAMYDAKKNGRNRIVIGLN